jgi:hypothetical protein
MSRPNEISPQVVSLVPSGALGKLQSPEFAFL